MLDADDEFAATLLPRAPAVNFQTERFMKNKISRFPALNLAVAVTRRTLTRVACLTAAILLAPGSLVRADASAGKIVVSGDEWAFSNDGLPNNPAYVTNVVNWFGLANGTGKKVLILDGQSWNSGYNGTQGAFGSDFQSLLNGMGVAVTYLGYQDDLVPLAGYDAVFVDGLMVKAATLTNDLAVFVRAGGAVYVAGGTGTFNPANATTEAAYWQPFLTAATGSGDFGLAGGDSWFGENPPLQVAGPVGNGITLLNWYMGQGVRVGSNPNASAAIWDSSHTLVATWLAPSDTPLQIQSPSLAGTNFTFSFQTVSNLGYTVEYNDDLGTTNWEAYYTLSGDGSLIQCLVPMTNSPQRFFRVKAGN
jgi:hypothetical protein